MSLLSDSLKVSKRVRKVMKEVESERVRDLLMAELPYSYTRSMKMR